VSLVEPAKRTDGGMRCFLPVIYSMDETLESIQKSLKKSVSCGILLAVCKRKKLCWKQRKDYKMALLEEWQKVAYNQHTDKRELQKFWQRYFLLEKGVYEKLLTNPDEKVEGTVKELAEKYDLSIMDMTGFLDGINDSLIEPNPIDTMEEDTHVSLAFDKEKLYKNMVDAKADWLYELPMWKEIFDDLTRKKLFLEQKKSGTVIVGKKVGRNDPCPCGSGKKYKHCCMNKQ